ncbi:unnamed protein product [Microthlaspi erraticum]|uniref:F-box domain-containing protein n=1 Tax=Microthlaspi erraticum TaxID=1685480 RepID=A0A6D2KFH9_9BRAS|nr:unnamed protein product [Microthlaspi erraticum]
MDLPEEVVVNIIARLPMQSIVRFRLVCREWKSLTESAFFRDLYHSTSNSTSCNWSILYGDYRSLRPSLKQVKLDLPSSHGNNNPSFPFCFTPTNNEIKKITVVASTDGLVLLRLYEEDKKMIRYYIGNPVLPQWIQLPPPPPPKVDYMPFTDSGLVTRMHNNVALLGYKVVRIFSQALLFTSRTWRFETYSSDTGQWSITQVCRPGAALSRIDTSNPVTLNGKLHWLDHLGCIFVHDFFSHDDQVRAISLPEKLQCGPDTCRKIIFTTSQGYCVLVDAQLIEEVNSYNVRIWRLNSDCWSWGKAWEINMASVGLGSSCVPMAINYFDIDVIYLWDSEEKCFLAFNRRTLAKSYGARKADTFSSSKPFSCLSQFVPSLHVVPT